ncbi:MAG TPA: Asp-tRNA(Asn)/Glu-tRNA(Gln) amidotransferase subunit GatB [Chitinophagaceae bacterium]|nr:Asp-tRNA(Asn)/Glu-tRNA(Gln) amidotransferase subunit GatB [Chitinophagaceae bacterium]
MSETQEQYEVVVGLEVHAQLLTDSKLFCGDSAAYGGEPNTHISPITLGYPGTLPVLNRKAVEYAVRMGLACHCGITATNYFARKNYFYPDLPKGYQLTQHTTPICTGGYVTIEINGAQKNIRLNRIHLEEDAGKSLHDVADDATCVDYNRAGVPLIEIVTEPDISSGEEAYAYLTALRQLLRYLEICDGNMEEGSMRCDANISVRKKGDARLGTKVEVKNLNSIRNVKRAIEHEAQRMIGMLQKGETIVQQTRSFDAVPGTTFALRTKEEANDYRYFPDPDIPPFVVTEQWIQHVQSAIPALPEARIRRYVSQLQLSPYDARQLTDEKEIADYFESVIGHTKNYKAAANWILGPIRSYLNENNSSITGIPLAPVSLAELVALVDEGKVNFSIAASRVLPVLMRSNGKSPAQVIQELNLAQTTDAAAVQAWVDAVIEKMPEKVSEYRKGKKGLMGLFVGEVKKLSKGKADPKLVNDMLNEKLNQ